MSNPNIARDSSKTFKKGQSGNPKGRPQGAKGLTTLLREALYKIAEGQKDTYSELLVRRVMKMAVVEGNEQMIKLCWSYLEGLPKETVDMNLTLPTPILNVIPANNSNAEDNEPQ